MIKTALIPPIKLRATYALQGDNYHLILSSVVQKSYQYAQFYSALIQKGHFVILDNDAHENGQGASYNTLQHLTDQLHPSEVVLPDRRFYGDDTYRLSKEAMIQFRKYGKAHTLPQFMGVAQGRTVAEWMTCAEKLIALGIDTLGITLDYEVWDGALVQRILDINNMMRTKFSDRTIPLQIHLLGWGRSLVSLRDAAHLVHTENFKRIDVRSTDSAKPFVYAANGIALSSDEQAKVPVYPGRSSNYFDLDTHDISQQVAIQNISIFKAYAHHE